MHLAEKNQKKVKNEQNRSKKKEKKKEKQANKRRKENHAKLETGLFATWNRIIKWEEVYTHKWFIPVVVSVLLPHP